MALLTWLKVFGAQTKRKLWNRRSLTFLFFLFLASVFWLITMLDEVTEQNFTMRLTLKNVPANVIITSELPPTIEVKLRDKGGILLAYRYGEELPPVEVDFSKYVNMTGKAIVPTLDLLRPMVQKLKGNMTIVSVSRESVEFAYSYGENKRVPVRFNGRVGEENGYMISGFKSLPDSVTVYAMRETLDTITAAFVNGVYDRSNSDTVSWVAALQTVRGAKFVPANVQFSLYYDRQVEKTAIVPVRWINFPATKVLRTFPSRVLVRFRVGMNSYRNVTADNFVIVVNYEEVLARKDNRIRLYLRSLPAGVTHAQIEPSEVEFVVETLPESE